MAIGTQFQDLIKKHVFFSFCCKDDLSRVNLLRHTWESAQSWQRNFVDNAQWEKAKIENPKSLKRLSKDALKLSTVTIVLIGENTWLRRFVLYEIARSFLQGNGQIGLQLGQFNCPENGLCQQGPNPYDQLGVYRAKDDNWYLAEWQNEAWVKYTDYQEDVTNRAAAFTNVPTDGQVTQLSNFYGLHAGTVEEAKANIGFWVEDAFDSRV